MSVEPEVRALEIVKQLEEICSQAESAIAETDALLEKSGVSRETMTKAFANMPSDGRSKGQEAVAADLEEIEKEVNAARQSLGQVNAKAGTSMKRMRRMI